MCHHLCLSVSLNIVNYVVLQNSVPADDFRAINQSDYTCSINDETIDVWRYKLSERSNPNSVKYVCLLTVLYFNSPVLAEGNGLNPMDLFC